MRLINDKGIHAADNDNTGNCIGYVVVRLWCLIFKKGESKHDK
jgi:hypothetical protein